MFRNNVLYDYLFFGLLFRRIGEGWLFILYMFRKIRGDDVRFIILEYFEWFREFIERKNRREDRIVRIKRKIK